MIPIYVTNRENTVSENVIDIDYNSFKYEYEKNSNRSIKFTIIKTNQNHFVYDMMQCENIITYNDQEYVIKTTNPKSKGLIETNDITAVHIMYAFQDHYIEISEKEEKGRTLKIKECLELGFKDNGLGFTFEIKGEFQPAKFDAIGGKSGNEFITEVADRFNAVMFADNKKIVFYDEKSFYIETEKVIRHLYNSDEVSISMSTTNLKTYVKAYGKKKENEDGKSDEGYVCKTTYESPNIKKYGKKVAPSITNDGITDEKELKSWAKSQLQDEPEIDYSTNYLGKEDVTEHDVVYFIHDKMNIKTQLKVTKLTISHPLIKKVDEVSFSNTKKDILQIQRAMQRKINREDNRINYQSEKFNQIVRQASSNYSFTTKTIGSVMNG